jgi:SAM-dependent methyltransferase
VESYVGIDYSESMIAVCKKRFQEIPERLNFHVADARSMPMFATGTFDFALFSYNGLDYIPHEERHLAIAEIRRVLRPGGRFAFSTHNLNNLRKRIRPLLGLNPKAFASKLFWLYGFLRHNEGLFNLRTSDYCEVYDGALGYRLRTHYVTPEYALEELTRSGFHDSKIFELTTGRSISATQDLQKNADDWLYYLTSAI